jgi:hypothetical protein
LKACTFRLRVAHCHSAGEQCDCFCDALSHNFECVLLRSCEVTVAFTDQEVSCGSSEQQP